jgi:LPXTG-motif cell wall-anchored protein
MNLDESGLLSIENGISDFVVMDECCKRSYIMGAFVSCATSNIIIKNYDKIAHQGYSFIPGGFYMDNGGMIFKAGSHVLTPPAATPAPAPAAPAPQAPADEYDHVPKTGETANYLYLLAFAVIALFGASVVAKKVK